MILIDTNVVSELIRLLAKPSCAPGQRSCQTASGDLHLRWRLGRLLQESDIHIHIEQAVPGVDATSDVPGDDLHGLLTLRPLIRSLRTNSTPLVPRSQAPDSLHPLQGLRPL